MQRFKKRLRLLTERHGGTISYGDEDSITVAFNTCTVRFSALDYDSMHCELSVGDNVFPIRAPKSYCFDIASRLAVPHLAKTLHQYQRGPLLELSDYIRDEHGGTAIEEFKRRLAADPTISAADFGGNRILAEYFNGVLILYDDLCTDATNVVEL